MKIAIDGTAASGKGTLGKRLSKILNLPYLDTGLLYRKTAFLYLNSPKVDIKENLNVKILDKIIRETSFDDLDVKSLQNELYGIYASKIAKLPNVRNKLKEIQTNVSNQMLNDSGGCILDGRDIGTNIMPNADYKFFIDANVEVRAKRRYYQLLSSSNAVDYNYILLNLKKRDGNDKYRLNSPLKPAKDAICIDTTSILPDNVVSIALSYIKKNKEK